MNCVRDELSESLSAKGSDSRVRSLDIGILRRLEAFLTCDLNVSVQLKLNWVLICINLFDKNLNLTGISFKSSERGISISS